MRKTSREEEDRVFCTGVLQCPYTFSGCIEEGLDYVGVMGKSRRDMMFVGRYTFFGFFLGGVSSIL